MNTRARRAYPFYIFLPSAFLCASWHKFCCKPSLCKDNFSQTASHIPKQLCTSSSEQRLDEGRDGFTFGALYLAAAWLRSKVANVTPRCGTEERFSPFVLRASSLPLFLPPSLRLFLSLYLSYRQICDTWLVAFQLFAHWACPCSRSFWHREAKYPCLH